MIRIITDSAADLGIVRNTKELTVVPLHINIDNVEYTDGVDITTEEFYDKIKEAKDFPKTSQPTPKLFYDAMKPGVEANDEILIITISSVLSGTISSATMAKEMLDYDKITIYDSLQATGGEHILVDEALKQVRLGKSVTEIIDILESVRKKIVYLTMVDDLSYLLKGGRLSKSEALIGNLTHIKPMLEIGEDGSIQVFHKALGKLRAYRYLVKRFRTLEIDNNYPIYSAYTDSSKNLDQLMEKLKDDIKDCKLIKLRFGSTIGTHLGSTGLGVFYVRK